MPERPDVDNYVRALDPRVRGQTEGSVLAARVLSRLLKDDWSKTVDDM